MKEKKNVGVQPCEQCGEPHSTLCESCGKPICPGCISTDIEDVPVCTECAEELMEEQKGEPQP